MSPIHQHSRRREFQKLRSEQTHHSLVAKRTLYINTFLSTSGHHQMHTCSKGRWKEQETHGCSEMKTAKASSLVLRLQTAQAVSWDSQTKSSGSVMKQGKKVKSSSTPGENRYPRGCICIINQSIQWGVGSWTRCILKAWLSLVGVTLKGV